MIRHITLCILFCLFFLVNAFAQNNANARKSKVEIVLDERAKLEKRIGAYRRTLAELENLFLSPAIEDLAEFAVFLQQPDTGIIRLLPREKYDKPEKMTTRGGGAYYSFSRLTHEYGYGSDIAFSSSQFSVGFAGADFGYMAKLTDISLTDIDLSDPQVEFLANFATPMREPDARVQQQLSSRGIAINGLTYKSRQSVELGASYLVRSINYHYSDLLVVFQVVRLDTDGSVILLYRVLKRFPKPDLIQ